MAYTVFNNMKISGISCAVPSHVEKVMDHADLIDKEKLENFTKNTGIFERRVRDIRQTASDLCFAAAQELLQVKKINPSSIDALIFVCQTEDYPQPSTAYVLSMRLGLSMDCMAFDVNLGCSGHVYGVHLASSLMLAGAKRVLLLTGETDYANPAYELYEQILFGTAGTATLLETCEIEGKIRTMLRSDGTGYKTLITPGGGMRHPITNVEKYYEMTIPRMDGLAVMGFTMSKVPQLLKEFLANEHKTPEEFDYCILHQANKMIIDVIRKKLKLPQEKVPLSIDRYANTSSASIPLTIVDLCERLNKSTTLKLLTSGFGIGLSWGVNAYEINTDDVLPMIETDEYFEDGLL